MTQFREDNRTERMISKTHLIRQEKITVMKRKTYMYLFIVLLFLILCVGFFWLPFLRIKTISLSPLLTVESSELQMTIETYISGNILYVFPRNNVFLINKNKLTKHVREQYSTLDTIDLQKDFTALKFIITERSPKTIWCQNQAEGSPCYFAHEDGTIFDIAGDFSNPLFFVFYTPLDNPDNPIDSLVLPREQFERVMNIQKLFSTYKIKLYGYQKDTEGTELFFLSPIIFGGSTPAYVKAHDVQSAETVVSKCITALKNDSLRDSQKKNFATLEYIDIRFNDQVSFKLK
jgi:hypothetical protein